jgi:hypothetical protein
VRRLAKPKEKPPFVELNGDDHRKELSRLIKQAAHVHDIYRIFNDFLEMSAISVSNAVDPTHKEERERRYLDLINAYGKEEQGLFPQMFAHLTEALEEKAQTTGPEDILGPLFHELELHQKYKGQFFTPQNVSDMMAMIACGDETQSAVKEKGYITMSEPTCGSGVMVTSMCKAMKESGLNYCSQLVVTAVDVDLKCVHMTYLQLSLYGIPAVVVHGNSITMQEWSRWYTPVYILNGWIWRERCGLNKGGYAEDEMIKCALEPTYAALRQAEALTGDQSVPDEAKTPEMPALTKPVYAPEKTAASKPRKSAQVAASEQLSLFENLEQRESVLTPLPKMNFES